MDKRYKTADSEPIQSILEIAARCTKGNLAMWPTMNQVPQALEQEVMSPYSNDYPESWCTIIWSISSKSCIKKNIFLIFQRDIFGCILLILSLV